MKKLILPAGWRFVNRSETPPPPLFCPKCDRCMYTKEDVSSRDNRKFCAECSETSPTKIEGANHIVTFVLGDDD